MAALSTELSTETESNSASEQIYLAPSWDEKQNYKLKGEAVWISILKYTFLLDRILSVLSILENIMS